MLENASERCRSVLDHARRHAVRFRHPRIAPAHLLLGLLDEGAGVGASTLRHLGVDVKAMRAEIERRLEPGTRSIAAKTTPLDDECRRALLAAESAARDRASALVGTEHLLLGLLAIKAGVAAAVLERFGVSAAEAAAAAAELKADPERPAADATRGGASRTGRRSASVLESVGVDLGARTQRRQLRPVCGRFPELEQMKAELVANDRPSLLLLGGRGVGKTSAIHALARDILIGAVPSALLCRRMIAIDRVRMLAGCRHKDALEQRIEALISEAERARDVILVFDDASWLLERDGCGPRSERVAPADGADALAGIGAAIAARRVQCVAALRASDSQRDAVAREHGARFRCISLTPPDPGRTLVTLAELREQLEQHHRVTITEDALRMAVQLALGAGAGDRLLRIAMRLVDESSARLASRAFTPPARASKLEREILRLEQERLVAFDRKDFSDAARCFEEARAHRSLLDQIRRRWKTELDEAVRTIDEQAIADTWSRLGGYQGITAN